MTVRPGGVRPSTMTTAGTALANATAMLADIASGLKVVIPPGTYALDAVVIPNGSYVDIEGVNAVLDLKTGDGGFQIADAATLSRARFFGLKFIGDGTTSVATQGAIWSNSSPTVNGITVDWCEFNSLPFGVQICHLSAGSVNNSFITNNRFVDMVGTSSGQGLGIALLGRDGFPLHAVVAGNYFYRCKRHSIYLSAGGSVLLKGNKIHEHRNGEAQSNLAGMSIARCWDVTAEANEFWGCQDMALRVETDSGTAVRNIGVHNNRFSDNAYIDIGVGTDDPNTNGVLRGINITGNNIYKKSNQNAMIYVDSAQGLRIVGNTLVQDEASAQSNNGLMRINGFGTSGSASWGYIVKDNIMILNVTGATRRAVAVHSNIYGGTARFNIGPNMISNATVETYLDGTLTNTALMLDGVIRRAGSPDTVVTPAFIGQVCVDTTNNDVWIATTAANTGWELTT